MAHLHRTRFGRLLFRLAFAFLATEGTLRLGAAAVERFSDPSGGAALQDRIVCIGDSNTAGGGAPRGSSYPDQLQQLLRDRGAAEQVVNLGVGGFSSRQIVDRLARRLQDGTPRVVLFLGGKNDLGWDPLSLLARPSAAGAATWLARLRTVRVLKTAWNLASGDVARADFGGSSARDVEPRDVPAERWDDEYLAARVRGADGIVPWLVHFFELQEPQRATRAWADLVATPDFAQLRDDLSFPLDCYDWELAMLRGGAPPPVVCTEGKRARIEFADYTAAWAELAAGRCGAARRAFEQQLERVVARKSPDEHWMEFLRFHECWALLMERDYAGADAAFGALLPRLERLITLETRLHALAGAAIAHLLRDPATRMADFVAPRAAGWSRWRHAATTPDGRGWMAVAEAIAAVKEGRRPAPPPAAGDPMRVVALEWLAGHGDATFDRLRETLPLGPPRVSWIGPRHCFLRPLASEEANGVLDAAALRLAGLAHEHGFPVIALTYLDYEQYEQRANPRMRAIAAANGFPLVDLRLLVSTEELGAEGKTRYFSPDRGHPNANGYGLFARLVLAELEQRGYVR